MGGLRWKAIDAIELVEAFEDSSLGDLIPAASGVYLWRRKLTAPDVAIASAEGCVKWIFEVADQPAARLPRRPLSPCVWSEGLQVGGGGLSEEKISTLRTIAARRDLRQLLSAYVQELSIFTPPVYIGQTNNLNARVKQHLGRETGLHSYLTGSLGLGWKDLEFQFLVLSLSTELSDESRSLQELLEMIAQRVLAPFATQRTG